MKLKRKRDNSGARVAPAAAPVLPFASTQSNARSARSNEVDSAKESSSQQDMFDLISTFSLPLAQKDTTAPPPPKEDKVRFDERIESFVPTDFVKKTSVIIECNFDLTSPLQSALSLFRTYVYSANTPITSTKAPQNPNLDVLWKTPKHVDAAWTFQNRKVQWQEALLSAFQAYCTSSNGVFTVDYDGSCTYNLFDALFYKRQGIYCCIISNPSLTLLSSLHRMKIPLYCTAIESTMHQRMDPTRCVYVISGRRHIFGVIDCLAAVALDVKSRRELYILPIITSDTPFIHACQTACSIASYRDNTLDADISGTKKHVRTAVISGIIQPNLLQAFCEVLREAALKSTSRLSIHDLDQNGGISEKSMVIAQLQDSLQNPFRVRTSTAVVVGGVTLPQVSELRAQQIRTTPLIRTGQYFKVSVSSNTKFYPYAIAACNEVTSLGVNFQYSVLSEIKWSQEESLGYSVTRLLLPETSIQPLDIKLLDKSDKGVEVVLEPLNKYSKFVE